MRARRRSSNPGGCDFAADPRLPASSAAVYWSVRSTQVIAAMATPNPLLDTAPFPTPWPAPQAERLAGDGQHLLFGDGLAQQLVFDGIGPPTALAAVIPFDADLPARVASLLDTWAHLTGATPRSRDASPQRRKRLVLGLRALDGRATGASYREIAAGLFGDARVPAGPAWKTHDLRSRTLRLVADATALMRGGYRTLAGLPPPPA